jgi:hypothetical protein
VGIGASTASIASDFLRPAVLERLAALVKQAGSAVWAERHAALGQLVPLALQHADALHSAGQMLAVFDCICARLADGNLNVSGR